MLSQVNYGSSMSKEIAQQWLQAASSTATGKDLQAHMDLISQKVNLTGIPGFDSICYADWTAQCQHEFQNNLLKSVRYDGLKLITETESGIMFKTYDTVEGTDGTVNSQGIEILLEKENDNKWRLVQERILPEDETAHDNLIP